MRLLGGLGYTNVRHYPGGLEEWTDKGEPVATAAMPAADPRTSDRVALIEPVPPPEPRASARRLARVPRLDLGLVGLIDRWSTGRLFVLWLGVIVATAAVYWLIAALGGTALHEQASKVPPTLTGFAADLYFSFVTATSVGYGDVLPIGGARAIAIAEAISGLLIFGAVIAKFVSHRQDEAIRQIQQITFEERLDRVQTNLYMVLSELQVIEAMCDEPPSHRQDRIRMRVESAVFLFGVELRTIHSLLYNPESEPDEIRLGAILASLAACMQTLGQLMACLPAMVLKGPTFGMQISRLTHVAQEICADCVPRSYAPALRLWMDLVQSSAREVARVAPLQA
ncbi:MAG TPA: potassium channel family protein [Candidatus Binataceae bacterium]|nr:potassium channel family protein [Candidatus Binataceae bacterium]